MRAASWMLKAAGEKLISIGTPAAREVADALDGLVELAAHAHAPEGRADGAVEAHLHRLHAQVLQARAVLRREVVAVGLDLELAAARGDALDHLEEVRVQHRLAAGEREVRDLVVHQLVDHAEDLVAAELVRERLARPALLDAVQAGEVALVGDLPRDVERRGEVFRVGGSRRSTFDQALVAQLGDEGAAPRARWPRRRPRSARPGAGRSPRRARPAAISCTTAAAVGVSV